MTVTVCCRHFDLATSFDEEDEQEQQERRPKNKRPLVGPPTAKNKVPTQAADHTETVTNSTIKTSAVEGVLQILEIYAKATEF